jgi:UDP-glucuronate 4-epimerase
MSVRRLFVLLTVHPSGLPESGGGRPDPSTSKSPWKIYNIGNSHPEELTYVVSLLEREFGRVAEKEMLPMQPGDVETTYADVTALERDIGFRPVTKIEDGIAHFAEWYREFTVSRRL